MSWQPFDNGESIGQLGSENGMILRDDEHSDGARITLEKDGDIAPFSITCGIYGWFFHTHFLGSEQEANTHFQNMQNDLSEILQGIPLVDDPAGDIKMHLVSESISQFVEKYP